MKKADRQHRFGGTYRERRQGSGWMNWYIGRRRLLLSDTPAGHRKKLRLISWRRTL